MLKCVPFNQAWASPSGDDLKAIYRRPSGDTTGPLPLRRHNDWLRKGFVYVTLADYESLEKVAPTLSGWQSFIQGPGRSPFNIDLYLQGVAETTRQELADLKELVAEFGAEAVTKIKRKDNPSWVMPQGIEAPAAPAKKAKAAA